MMPIDPLAFARLSYDLNRERVDSALRRNRAAHLNAKSPALPARRNRDLRALLVAAITAFLPIAR